MSARDEFDTLTPNVEVHLGSDLLAPEAVADLVSVRVLEDVDACGTCALTFAAWDSATMKPKWIDDPKFKEGAAVNVSLGYADRLTSVFGGEITGIEPDFLPGRPPTVTFRVHDLRHRLMRACRSRAFVDCTESDIARQIAQEAELTPDVEDSGVTLPYVLQHNQTDLEFLSSRAMRLGYDVWVRDSHLVFRPPKLDGDPALTLQREFDVLSFQPRLSTLRQVTDLEVRGWDPSRKRQIVGQGRGADEPTAMGEHAQTGPAVMQGIRAAASARVAMPVHSQEEADAIAQHGFADMALRFIRGEGVAVGQPQLRAGTLVKLEGFGDRFSGTYYLSSVEHEFDKRRGYRTRFSVRRNAR